MASAAQYIIGGLLNLAEWIHTYICMLYRKVLIIVMIMFMISIVVISKLIIITIVNMIHMTIIRIEQ